MRCFSVARDSTNDALPRQLPTRLPLRIVAYREPLSRLLCGLSFTHETDGTSILSGRG